MKNLAKMLVASLLVGLFGVVAVSSLMAQPVAVQTTTATTSFNGEYGIRWNAGFEVFEVFNEVGVSYIGSGVIFNENGEKNVGTVNATGDKTYHIMQDIVYENNALLNPAFVAGERSSILAGGVVNGRGFSLKGFLISPVAGAALFFSNAGTIINLRVQSPIYVAPDEGDSSVDTGIICKTNNGTIEDCSVSGAISASLTKIELNIAAIAYSGSGTIRNCSNRLSISTDGAYVGGIMGNAIAARIIGCTNQGAISASMNSGIAGGIVAFIKDGSVMSNFNHGTIVAYDAGGIIGTREEAVVIVDNRNYGFVRGVRTAVGILGGMGSSEDTNIKNNFHYGELLADNRADIYLGDPSSAPVPPPPVTGYDPTSVQMVYSDQGDATQGIRFFETNGEGKNVFLITAPLGFSHIGLGTKINADGNISEDAQAKTTTKDSHYYVTRDINYDDVKFAGVGFGSTVSLDSGGLFDGQHFKLTNFPLKSISDASSAIFATIASGATVRNVNLALKEGQTSEESRFSRDAGGLAYRNNGTIQNCKVSGNVKTIRSFGGIACASANGIFKNCENYVSIDAVSTALALCYGGVFASGEGSIGIIDSVNFGSINSSYNAGATGGVYAGGLIGLVNRGTSAALERSVVGAFGSFLFTGSFVVGSYSIGSITVVREEVVGSIFVGGLVGMAHASTDQLFDFYLIYCGALSGVQNHKIEVPAERIRVGGLVGCLYTSGGFGVFRVFGYSDLDIVTVGVSDDLRAGGIIGVFNSNGALQASEIVVVGTCEYLGRGYHKATGSSNMTTMSSIIPLGSHAGLTVQLYITTSPNMLDTELIRYRG